MVKVLLSKIARYYYTIRYLKPSQVFWRLWYKVHFTKPDLRPCPRLRRMDGHWVSPIERPQSLMGDWSFNFLNDVKRLETVGWDGPNCEKLWRYNQHYFDDLNAIGASKRYDLECPKNSQKASTSAQKTAQTAPSPSQMESQTLPNQVFKVFWAYFRPFKICIDFFYLFSQCDL